MKRKGARLERELVNILWKSGFAAIRAPSSGSASKNPLPDIIAGNGKRYLAIEVKSRKKLPFYIQGEEIKSLKNFCGIFGAEPYIGLRIDYQEWRFIHVTNLKKTEKENYRIDEDVVFGKGIDIHELTGVSRQVKLVDN